MKTLTLVAFALLVLGFCAGCGFGPKSGRGFVFPEGDAERGKKAFVDLKCYSCHRVESVLDLPPPIASPERVVRLGGKVARLRTYGDLVTSVIHPSYALSDNFVGPARVGLTESPMKKYNDVITVQQMLDIVTFLQPTYKTLEPVYRQNYHVP